ncbi:B3 domain-containing protein REM17 isoform X7 [Capsicum annuum]|uniref:B3 domain-containing protein REM17 isoform X7 n=1 Tax=Capsicum annuum TaxID=4072 RepID=UPI0007BF2107|nr:B3 domain-containing protein REM17 isoform X7 [Capsicum annuum]
MKIPPKKPHFFKPILPDFNNGLKIPIGFLKYLKGQEHVKCAVLKRDGKKWRVKVNGRKLEEGNWGKFVKEFDLQVGNILVFSHEGSMEFEVSIFDSSQCSREYAEYMQEDVIEDVMEVDEEEDEEDEYVVEEEEEDEYEEEEDEVEEEEEEEVVTDDNSCERSYFEYTITPYCLSFRACLFLPQQFALANDLTNKKCKLIIRDERQRSWKLKICSSSNPRPRAYIGSGWRKFIAENSIKEGDRIKFEVVTNGKTPIWKFQVDTDYQTPMRKFQEKLSPNIDLPNMTSSHAEADTNKPFVRSHFVCTITQKMFSRGLLYVPKKFAIANGLTNKKCGLIVRDERQRSWNLKLSFGGTQAQPYIGYGLRKLIAENCTKEGDRIKFEVVTNGKTPIWKFQVFTDGEIPMKTFQERPSPSIKLSNKTSSHAEAATNKPFVQSHFECTIREYCLSRGLLYLPKQFAFANCLINKKHDLIIRDERQKSWNLKLCYCQTDVYIGDGWRKFVADNCLKEGDRIMFEVVTSGETPVWEFRVNEAKTPLQKYQDIMKKPSNTSPLNAQVSTSTSGDDDHPYFISTIKRYCIRKTELYFPLDFAKSNGLNRKCEMILKDETERCWSVWLGRLGTHFGITRGWTKFRTENGLQVGDAYKFELIKNGEIPIAHFHCKYSAKVAKRKKQ